MQTGATATEQVVEGIQAGVSYYLTKPFEPEVLLSLIQAASRDAADVDALQAEVRTYQSMLELVEQSDFSFRTLAQAHALAAFLSAFSPDPERVVLGLLEMLLNAVEHGNVEITYEEKTRLVAEGTWEQEVLWRLALPENADKKVHVHYEKTPHEILLSITDEGQGFDWARYLDLSLERANHSHGRGIAMSKMLSFHEILYLGCGNQVVCKVNLARDEEVES